MKKIIQLTICLLFSASLLAQEVKPFESGERAVFVGNSITDGGHYHSYIWLYYMTRFPNRKIEIFNAGINADMVSNMQKRFDADVLPHNPTYIVLSFGMNDSGYGGYDKADRAAFGEEMLSNTKQNFSEMEAKLKAIPNLNVTMLSSTAYEEQAELPNNPASSAHKGKTAVMLNIADFQQKKARENNWGFVDFLRPTLEINKQGQLHNPSFTISGGDRVHPAYDGHMVMAYEFLKAQGFNNHKVADVEIDAKRKVILKTENSKLANLDTNSTSVKFSYLPNALPYPLDTIHLWGSPSQYEGAQLVPFFKEMNEELLTVKGLSKGTYSLAIDSEPICELTAKELAEGINLATYTHTPQYQQALSIMYLNEERWEIERRLRLYMGAQYRYLEGKDLLFADDRKTLNQLQSELDTHHLLPHVYPNYTKAMFPEIRKTWELMQQLLVDRIYTMNKPVERIIEIRRIDK